MRFPPKRFHLFVCYEPAFFGTVARPFVLFFWMIDNFITANRAGLIHRIN